MLHFVQHDSFRVIPSVSEESQRPVRRTRTDLSSMTLMGYLRKCAPDGVNLGLANCPVRADWTYPSEGLRTHGYPRLLTLTLFPA
jgi:hypothetical protein